MRTGCSASGSAARKNDRWVASLEKHAMIPKETDGHERDLFRRADRSRVNGTRVQESPVNRIFLRMQVE